MIKKVKEEFMKASTDDISSFGSVQGYTKYAKDIDYYLKNGIQFETGTPMRNKASISYNYIIKKNKFPLMEISDGSKIKYSSVKTNKYGIDVIAWVGNYPKEFEEIFEIDYEDQFEKTLLRPIVRFHVAIGWTDEKDRNCVERF